MRVHSTARGRLSELSLSRHRRPSASVLREFHSRNPLFQRHEALIYSCARTIPDSN